MSIRTIIGVVIGSFIACLSVQSAYMLRDNRNAYPGFRFKAHCNKRYISTLKVLNNTCAVMVLAMAVVTGDPTALIPLPFALAPTLLHSLIHHGSEFSCSDYYLYPESMCNYADNTDPVTVPLKEFVILKREALDTIKNTWFLCKRFLREFVPDTGALACRSLLFGYMLLRRKNMPDFMIEHIVELAGLTTIDVTEKQIIQYIPYVKRLPTISITEQPIMRNEHKRYFALTGNLARVIANWDHCKALLEKGWIYFPPRGIATYRPRYLRKADQNKALFMHYQLNSTTGQLEAVELASLQYGPRFNAVLSVTGSSEYDVFDRHYNFHEDEGTLGSVIVEP